MKLQRQLTLSHLTVTVVSLLILLPLVLFGYYQLNKGDAVVAWVADWSFFVAEDIEYLLEETGQTLNSQVAQSYVDVARISQVLDNQDILFNFVENSEDISQSNFDSQDNFEYDSEQLSFLADPIYEDWLLITDLQGIVLGSNYQEAYPLSSNVQDNLPPGFDLTQRDIENAIRLEEHIVGQVQIIDMEDKPIGWVYYRSADQEYNSMLGEIATQFGLFSLAAAAIATLLSGLIGWLLARSFGKRIGAISQASQAFAEGDFTERVDSTGKDELSQLGNNYNQMADRISSQVKDLKNLAENNAKLAEEAQGLAKLEERNRIARDLHDAIKQQLFGLHLTAGSAVYNLESNPETSKANLEQIANLSQEILEEMDTIIGELRPASLGDEGLIDSLRNYLDQIQHHDLQVFFESHGERELPLNIEQAIFRVVQEALNNVIKHAEATEVEIRLNYGLSGIDGSIKDNGVGLGDAEIQDSNMGLLNMRNRIEELGGLFKITGIGGTKLEFSIPHLALNSNST